MLQLRLELPGSPPAVYPVARLPVIIGRAPGSDLRVEAPGVWDQHLRIGWEAQEGVWVERLGEALATVNGAPFDRRPLTARDRVGFGAASLEVTLSPPRLRHQQPWEILLWVVIAAATLAQGALLWGLLRNP